MADPRLTLFARRVRGDITPNARQVSFVTHDVVVVVALPQCGSGRSPIQVDLTRRGGFEGAHHGTERTGDDVRGVSRGCYNGSTVWIVGIFIVDIVGIAAAVANIALIGGIDVTAGIA